MDKGDQPHCLRLQRNRVFYVREDVMRRATNVSLFCRFTHLAHWE